MASGFYFNREFLSRQSEIPKVNEIILIAIETWLTSILKGTSGVLNLKLKRCL